MKEKTKLPYIFHPSSLYFLLGLILVNSVALFNIDYLYVGAFFSFIYILITPGFLFLSLLTKKKLPSPLGITMSVALSMLILMLAGLALNTFLPMFGMREPLSTIPLLLTLDGVILFLFLLNYEEDKESAFEIHEFDLFNWVITGVAFLMPIFATLGSIILNNQGSSFVTQCALGIAFLLFPIIMLTKNKAKPALFPLTLYLMALSFLLMNSMRGWFITGHDILLEHHVFVLTHNAHLWSMAFYQDPYNACLSLTIFPTYLLSLMHVSDAYIFKFFTQFIGALPVVIVYYLTRQFTSEKIAFLTGFLYITFPTFMVDMAFLNRQGIAFVFFSSLVYLLLNTEYISGRRRLLAMFMFGIGMIISHYSTSYIAVPVLLCSYGVNRVLRFVMNLERPRWFFRLTNRIANKEAYKTPILIPFVLVVGLLLIMVLWSSVITKTSKSLVKTINQIAESIKDPFSEEGYKGPAKYSLLNSDKATPQELFDQFTEDTVDKFDVEEHQSLFYPPSITEKYKTIPVAEMPAPLTSFGKQLQSAIHIDLIYFYSIIKQVYAKILQVLLFIGLMVLFIGYSFKKNILHDIPVEYIAISIAGLLVMVGQTILPAGAIDYGLLRLFQQNLTFLAMPITIGLLSLTILITRKHYRQLALCCFILLFFFSILSGFIPQMTGGSRALLSLNNTGLYYDSYYTHAEEVAATRWTARFADSSLPVQAAHFSDIKMIAYGYVAPYIELLPETTKRRSYEYLNYDNVMTDNIIEIIQGEVVYYKFPIQFLDDHKNLIYNNGGSEIYR